VPKPWGSHYSDSVKVIRLFAMIGLAPISEELLFRGLLYHMIEISVLKRVGAIAITAVGFAALHYQYGVRGFPFALADGLLFGIARCSTGSTILTMVLHALGNCYAAYQRL
jgi:membrane protease YdiL (CAAX protease family)